jgi:hypothetical protein
MLFRLRAVTEFPEIELRLDSLALPIWNRFTTHDGDHFVDINEMVGNWMAAVGARFAGSGSGLVKSCICPVVRIQSMHYERNASFYNDFV